MAFRLEIEESVEHGIKRVVREQLNKALAEIDDKTLPRHEVVHQVRKRCKKIRGALRLIRSAFDDRYRFENAFFRDTARELSGLRDAEVMVKTLDALLGAFRKEIDPKQFGPLRQKLAGKRQRTAQARTGRFDRLHKVRMRLSEARERIADWRFKPDNFEAIEGGLLKTYGRGRKALRRA